MTVARLAISLDRDLARAVRKAAGKRPTSAWVAEALESKLRSEGLLAVVADYEAEHGMITDAELAAVAHEEETAIQVAKRAAARRRKRSSPRPR
jgi:hypothetical protein